MSSDLEAARPAAELTSSSESDSETQVEPATETATETATEAETAARWHGLRQVLAPATVVLLLDQLSKLAIISWLPHRTGWPELDSPIGAFFRFYHSHNTGVAFGLFQGNNGFFVIVALLVVGGLLWYQTTLPAEDRWTRLALGLQVGGALGNVIDRLRLGHVTDFLDFHIGSWHWPTFNLADSAIVIGVFLLMIQLWRMDLAEQRAAVEAPESRPSAS